MFSVTRVKAFIFLFFLSAYLFAQQNSVSPLITTPSGLQYEVISRGSGQVPGPTDTVRIRFKMTHSDGNVVVNPLENIEVLRVDYIITGLSEGLQLMNKGSIYRFVIPPHLNAPWDNSTSVYIIELISILISEEIIEEEKRARERPLMPPMPVPDASPGTLDDLILDVENMSDEEFFNFLLRMF
jgi:hypothetical protein